MSDVVSMAVAGSAFGLSGGFSPGPTTTVMVAQAIRYGAWEGVKVAIAPVLTDAPIIIAAVLLVGRLAEVEWVLGVVTLLGAGFLTFMAFDNLRVRPVSPDSAGVVAPHSIAKGFVANLLNPHPYLFWLTIGATKLVAGWQIGVLPAVGFLIGMYVCLVGAKVLVAVLVARSRTFLQSRAYLWINRLLGLVLFGYALMFLRDGLSALSL